MEKLTFLGRKSSAGFQHHVVTRAHLTTIHEEFRGITAHPPRAGPGESSRSFGFILPVSQAVSSLHRQTRRSPLPSPSPDPQPCSSLSLLQEPLLPFSLLLLRLICRAETCSGHCSDHLAGASSQLQLRILPTTVLGGLQCLTRQKWMAQVKMGLGAQSPLARFPSATCPKAPLPESSIWPSHAPSQCSRSVPEAGPDPGSLTDARGFLHVHPSPH